MRRPTLAEPITVAERVDLEAMPMISAAIH
jgi:hypothetical protein